MHPQHCLYLSVLIWFSHREMHHPGTKPLRIVFPLLSGDFPQMNNIHKDYLAVSTSAWCGWLTCAFQQVIICYICSSTNICHARYVCIFNMPYHLNNYSLYNHTFCYFAVPCGLDFFMSLAIFYAAAGITVRLFACHVPLSSVKALLSVSAEYIYVSCCHPWNSFSVKFNKLTHFQLVSLTLAILVLEETRCFQAHLHLQSVCANRGRSGTNIQSYWL